MLESFLLRQGASDTSMTRLCDVRFTTVQANLNLKEVTVHSKTGDFNPTSLAQVINTDTINQLIVQTWLDRACRCIFLSCKHALDASVNTSNKKVHAYFLCKHCAYRGSHPDFSWVRYRCSIPLIQDASSRT